MDIGKELSEARQRAGLSREQISQQTKIPLRNVEALDQNAFEQLPTGFYLISIVRAYARTAGIDPEPLVQHLRAAEEPHASTPAVAITPAAHEPNSVRNIDEHGGQPRRWFPAAILAMFLGAFGLGAFLVQQFGTSSEEVAASTETSAPRSPATRPGRPGPVDSTGSPGPVDPARVAPAGRPGPMDPARGAGVAGSVGTSGQNRTAPAAAARQDYSGPWLLSTEVESSSVATFEGLRLGYRVQLRQEGNTISGTGHKVSENGRALGGVGQTPISVSGTVDGDRLTLIFVEHGARRPSKGTFELKGDSAGLWGRFSSDAARSAGTVEGRRS